MRVGKAELAFREGRFFEAEVLAASVSELEASDRLRFEALALAGRAAHIASRDVEALAYFREARARATTARSISVAALGELAAAIDLELPEAHDLLDALSQCGSQFG